MKIDFIVTDLAYGGAEIQVVALARSLSATGHDVRVISLLQPQEFEADLQESGVALDTLGMTGKFEAVVAGLRLRSMIRKRRPDVVHAHMVHANILTRLALAGTRTPLVCTVHNTIEGGTARDLAYRYTNSLSTLNTTVSDAATVRFLRKRALFPANTRTMYNGIDVARFHAVETTVVEHGKPFRWIAVGRLVYQKDYPTLLGALSKLENSTLDIYGEGPLRNELQQIVQAKRIEARVSFRGVNDQIENAYRNADGFVLSSRYEGFGLVVAEAMATELPVVATDCGGVAEIIGDVGSLVAVGNSDALASAMAAIEDMLPDRRYALGVTGRARIVEKFGLDAIRAGWLELYKQARRQVENR